jgi:hypothetical protein
VSYARMGPDSDVYVYADAEVGRLRCCGCMADFSTTAGMIDHLREHIANGDAVPDRTIPALEAEGAKNDAWMASADI